MTESQQQIVVHTHNDASNAKEIIRFLGALIIFGGVGVGTYMVCRLGYAEMAASGLTVLIIQFVKLLAQHGVLSRPHKKTGKTYFQNVFGDLSGWARDLEEFKRDRTIWQFAGIALVYAVAFVLLRQVVAMSMGIFQNLLLSIAVCMIVGGALAAPDWYLRYTEPAKAAGILRPDALTQAELAPAVPASTTPAAPVQPAPAPDSPAPTRRRRRPVTKVEKDDA